MGTNTIDNPWVRFANFDDDGTESKATWAISKSDTKKGIWPADWILAPPTPSNKRDKKTSLFANAEFMRKSKIIIAIKNKEGFVELRRTTLFLYREKSLGTHLKESEDWVITCIKCGKDEFMTEDQETHTITSEDHKDYLNHDGFQVQDHTCRQCCLTITCIDCEKEELMTQDQETNLITSEDHKGYTNDDGLQVREYKCRHCRL